VDASGITSIVSAGLTAVYVVLTGFLNHHARRSADAAKTSADAAKTSAASSEAATSAALETARASQRAAEAAERSAALSEAAIPVDFSARVFASGSNTIVKVRSETASVHVFSIYVQLLVVPDGSGSVRELSGTTTVVGDEGEPVLFVHQGAEAMAFLTQPLTPGDTVIGHATVRYGFVPEQVGRERVIEISRQQVMSLL
jgi:hypothetical protein